MMDTAITLNAARRLYWKGRYLQRAQSMLKELVIGYDNVIDRDHDYGRYHYAKLDIEIDYGDAHDFLRQGVYGNHGSSIASMIYMARENAIEIRNLLDEREFARLNLIHNRIVSAQAKVITPSMLEDFIDDLSFILGIFSSELGRTKAYNFVRLGQYVERFDLILRLYGGFDYVNSELDAMNTIAKRLNHHYQFSKIFTSDLHKALAIVNGVIDRVIEEKVCILEVYEKEFQTQG
ncbi:MAG: alpha-E domain-containing protein [Sulfuricurvum sp.]|nr:alpha-E domain-containing protein [Sulfuricurvum sp.]